jgi:hypothetical protein
MSSAVLHEAADRELLLPRRLTVPAGASPAAIAAAHGCAASAVVQMFPFLVDSALVTIVASANSPAGASDLLHRLGAACIQSLRARDLLLAVRFAWPQHRVYIDAALLHHDELLLCLEPPCGYGVTTPAALRDLLGASVLGAEPAAPG